MSHHPKHIYAFGPYRLDSGERLLARDGLPIALQPKAFDLLLALVERHGHLLTKDELLRVVWPDSVVEEVNLANNVSILRKTLGEGEQQFIETVPRHGYRFVAPVEEEVPAKEIQIAEPHLPENLQPPSAVSRRKKRPLLVVALTALLCIGLAGAVIQYFSDRQPVTPNLTTRSIAVLPFKPIAARERDELLELGMADALITKLSGTGQLVVRPTGAVRRYVNAEPDPLAAGRDLRVEFVLEGSLLKSADRVRVTARLLRVADETAVWAATLEEKQTDLFRIQDSVSQQVAESLSLKLTREQQARLSSRSIRNTEAFRLYVQGRYFQDTTEGIRKAVDLLTRAIESDPNYAPAHVALSEVWQAASVWHLPPVEAMPKAKAAAEQALRLDDQLPEAHVKLGWVKWNYDWDWSGAERDFRRAIELDPARVESHSSYAWFLSCFPERHDEALAEIQLANELDPRRPHGLAVFYNIRRYDQTIEQCRKVLAISPDTPAALQWLGLAYEQKAMSQEAIAVFQKSRQLDDTPDMRAYLGHAWARSGEREKAVRMLDELKRLSQERYVSPFFIALIHLGLGENDQAFAYLEQAYRERNCWLTGLSRDPRFDHLRADPRFTDLLRRVGLAP
jgi:DNA-binding winged helix-turn-helix (wHTH) protein/TolB-like protein